MVAFLVVMLVTLSLPFGVYGLYLLLDDERVKTAIRRTLGTRK